MLFTMLIWCLFASEKLVFRLQRTDKAFYKGHSAICVICRWHAFNEYFFSLYCLIAIKLCPLKSITIFSYIFFIYLIFLCHDMWFLTFLACYTSGVLLMLLHNLFSLKIYLPSYYFFHKYLKYYTLKHT